MPSEEEGPSLLRPRPLGRWGIMGPRGGHHQSTAAGEATTQGRGLCTEEPAWAAVGTKPPNTLTGGQQT